MLSPLHLDIDLALKLPADINIIKIFSFLLFFGLTVLFVSILARFLLGKNSNLKGCICVGLSIIMMYAIAIVLYALAPEKMGEFVNALPFGQFTTNDDGQRVLILNIFHRRDQVLDSTQLLKFFSLAFLVSLIQGIELKNTRKIGWILVRLVMLAAGIAVYFFFIYCVTHFIPEEVLTEKLKYAPLMVLSILGFCFLLGLLKGLLALLLIKVDPLFGVFYAFFFDKKFGKNITYAIGATILVIFLMWLLEQMGYGVIPVGLANLSAYIPFAACIFLLWFIVCLII